ncbi:MAG: flagellar biosynthesis regulator FlaF [Pseudomonadota bacterium]
MISTTRARTAYLQSARSTSTPRAIEHQVLSRLTGALVAGEAGKTEDYPSYVRALSRNLEFWTILGADMAHPENGLPADLRAQIFYLFEFTRAHTNKILNAENAPTAKPLIEVNNNIISGLRTRPSSQMAAAS